MIASSSPSASPLRVVPSTGSWCRYISILAMLACLRIPSRTQLDALFLEPVRCTGIFWGFGWLPCPWLFCWELLF
jgi:hypothetical protein